MKMHYFRAQNCQFVPNKYYLVQTIITFIYLLALFLLQNLKKSLKCIQSSWGCAIFGPNMVHLPETKVFLEKIINIIFIFLSVPSIEQNFKKILTADTELWECAIFGPKMAHLSEWELFQKTC